MRDFLYKFAKIAKLLGIRHLPKVTIIASLHVHFNRGRLSIEAFFQLILFLFSF